MIQKRLIVSIGAAVLLLTLSLSSAVSIDEKKLSTDDYNIDQSSFETVLNEDRYYIDDYFGYRGESYTIVINGVNEELLCGWGIALYFDPDVLEVLWTTHMNCRGWDFLTFDDFNNNEGWCFLATSSIICPPGEPPGEGCMGKIIFRVKDDAPIGTTALDLDQCVGGPCHTCDFTNDMGSTYLVTDLTDGTFTVLPPPPLYVGGGGPGNYSSIQAAINDAVDGDTVFVYDDSSPYYENVLVNKSIELLGENRDTTIIDAGGNEDVVHISAEGAYMSGFTLSNSGNDYSAHNAGIYIQSANNTITGNTIINNSYGVNIDYADNNANNNIVTNNIIHSNDHSFFTFSSGNTLADNTIDNNVYGPMLFGPNNIATGNVVSNNGWGIDPGGGYNTISRNTILNNNGGGIVNGFGATTGNTITDNIVNNNENGILLSQASDTVISRNRVVGNSEWGIVLAMYHAQSYNTTICGNMIKDNNIGIRLQGSYESTIVGNIIRDNIEYGISIVAPNNYIYNNNLINNAINAEDNQGNFWNSSYPIGGNHWDDYFGVDLFSGPGQNISGSDGIGDTPYEIPCEHSSDYYPLMDPYSTGLFTRGDANGDGDIVMSDAIFILKYRYVPDSPEPYCFDAADVDDNGAIETADVIYLLRHLYLPSSPDPPAPFPDCGSDPTDDELDCQWFGPCISCS